MQKFPSVLTGLQFERLSVHEITARKGYRTYYRCTCSCGNEKVVERSNLISGHVRSCGCLMKELASKRVATHRMSKTPEYLAWIRIKRRCIAGTNPRYKACGVTVHPSWVSDFDAFYAEIGPIPSPSHTIDRIKNEKGYEPGNVRWATAREQQWNLRRNRMVEYRGESVPAAKLAFQSGLNVNVLMNRIKRGWSVERAMSTPVQGR